MTNEQLVPLARAGDRDALTELWTRNRGLVWRIVGRYRTDGALYDMDDLMQAGFLGLVDAVQGYDPDRGVLFMTYAVLHIRRTARELVGLRGRRRVDTVPIDAPLGGTEDFTLADTLEDTTLPDMDDLAVLEDSRHIVREAVGRLPPAQEDVMRRRYWRGETFTAIAAARGEQPPQVRAAHDKAFRALYRDVDLYRLRKETPTGYYSRKSVRAFKSSFTSSVEDVVLQELEENT